MVSCSLSQKLREIPAAQSESNALYGLDPMHLSQLALRDATRAAAMLPKQPTAHLQQVCSQLALQPSRLLACIGGQAGIGCLLDWLTTTCAAAVLMSAGSCCQVPDSVRCACLRGFFPSFTW